MSIKKKTIQVTVGIPLDIFFTSLEISLLSQISRGVAALLSCYCFAVIAVVIVLRLGALFC